MDRTKSAGADAIDRGSHRFSASYLPTARRLVQTAVVLLTAIVGYRMASGRSPDGIEVFCPFGGVETAYSLLGGGRFTCAAGAGNLAILFALLLLTVLARKAFCAWVCPLGAVAEGMARLGRVGKQAFGKNGWSRSWDHQLLGVYTPAPRVDRVLRWLRLPVLALILFFTFRTGELVFRSFDPYYILFSFHGHDVRGYSYGILGGVLALAVVMPMAWCRYLCPLGGLLWPFSRVGLLRIGRNQDVCTGCRACDLACPHSIEVSRSSAVHSGECTLCLECSAACPRGTALALGSGIGTRRAVAGWLVPALVVLLAAAGMGGARWIRIPSLVHEFPQSEIAGTRPDPGAAGRGVPVLTVVRMTIEGVRCVDTSEAAIRQLGGIPGIHRATAYAARHEIEVLYDPDRVDAETIRRAFEAPYQEPGTGQYVFHRFHVVEIGNERIGP